MHSGQVGMDWGGFGEYSVGVGLTQPRSTQNSPLPHFVAAAVEGQRASLQRHMEIHEKACVAGVGITESGEHDEATQGILRKTVCRDGQKRTFLKNQTNF